jgi:ketosteroid isomerase-like protein
MPINGATYYQEQEDKPNLLEWEPAFADISRAGRMGYTTGPWKYRPDSTDADPSVFGHYVSVWRRPPGGEWKVVLDVGVPHPKPDTTAVELTWPREPEEERAQVVVDFEAAQEALMEVDRELSEASVSEGSVEALLAKSSDDIRLYRTGVFPAHGKEAAREILADTTGLMSWEPEAGSLARSGDLGYTYGTAEWRASANDAEPQKKFSYARIWKKGDYNRWEIVVDVALEKPAGQVEEDQ